MRRALACQVVIAAACSSVFVRYALWSVVTGPLSERYGTIGSLGAAGGDVNADVFFFLRSCVRCWGRAE